MSSLSRSTLSLCLLVVAIAVAWENGAATEPDSRKPPVAATIVPSPAFHGLPADGIQECSAEPPPVTAAAPPKNIEISEDGRVFAEGFLDGYRVAAPLFSVATQLRATVGYPADVIEIRGHGHRAYIALRHDGCAFVDGKPIRNLALRRFDSTYFVHVRPLAEALGARVAWLDGSSVVIYFPAATAASDGPSPPAPPSASPSPSPSTSPWFTIEIDPKVTVRISLALAIPLEMALIAMAIGMSAALPRWAMLLVAALSLLAVATQVAALNNEDHTLNPVSSPSPHPMVSPSPTSHTALIAHPNPDALAAFFLAVLTIAVIFAFWRRDVVRGDPLDRRLYFSSPAWRFVQSLLIGLLIIGAVWHSVVNDAGPDNVTLLYFVLIVIVCMAPFVQKIGFPGSGSVDLASELTTDTQDLEQNARLETIGAATAGSIVSNAQANLAIASKMQLTAAVRASYITRALATTSEAIAPWLRSIVTDPPQSTAGPGPAAAALGVALPPPERVRVSAWLKDPASQRLLFAAGWPDQDVGVLQGLAAAGAGDPAIAVFTSNQFRNYGDLPNAVRPPAGQATYHGILILPLPGDGQPIGTLIVERGNPGVFEASRVPLAQSLAAFYAQALS